jgi:RHH-type rel operon transcriptional repressor/antitoxin RelB
LESLQIVFSKLYEYKYALENDMPTSVRLPMDMEHRLTSIVARSGRSRAQFIREAVEGHIDAMENLVAATEVLACVQRGEQQTPEHAEILRRVGWK